MKAYLSIILGIIGIYNIGKGQDMPTLIRPSPEAAALGKYGEIPVSTYTGIPNINIPLYTVQDGDITVPISLSYHAGGIKVEEEAPWTGLGFSLSAGGEISRSIRGRNDFETPRGYIYNVELPDNLDYGMPYQRFPDPLRTTRTSLGLAKDPYFLNKNSASRDYRSLIESNNYDWESDLYYFNANGLSGKFVFDKQGNPVLISNQNISIQVLDIPGANKGWLITDDRGYKYQFYQSQISYNVSDENVTAWYLTQIESPTGVKVDFEYSHYEYGQTSTQFIVRGLPGYYENRNDGGLPGSCGSLPSSSFITQNKYQAVYLRKIKFRNGYVEFLRNTDYQGMPARKDLLGAELLASVKIYQQSNENQTPQLFKEYKFDYDYFTSGGSGGNYEIKFATSPEFDYGKSRLRLKLKSVTEFGKYNTSNPPYLFTYNESIPLPPKASFSRDYWGYNNGVDNTQLVSEYQAFFPDENGNQKLYYFFGANRNSTDASKACVLEKITYPTGGETKFTFHVNEYSNFLTPEFESQKYGPYYYNQGKSSNTGPISFTVNTKSEVSLRFEIHQTDYVFDPHKYFYTQLLKNGTVFRTWDLEGIKNDIDQGGATYYTYKIVLDPATYQLTGNLPQDGSEKVTIRVVTTWAENSTTPLSRKACGGLRVEKIEDFDPVSGITNTRTFNYDADNGFSSGVLMSYPRFYRGYENACNVLNRTSFSNIPLSASANGSIVGYSKVTIFYGSNGENGKSEFYYHNNPDQEKHLMDRIPNVPTYPDPENGNLVQQIDYLKKNTPLNTYGKIKETINNYSVGSVPLNKVWNMKIELVTIVAIGAQEPYEYMVAHYGDVSWWNRLVSTTTKIYDAEHDTKYAETKIQYEYANSFHLQPTKITSIDSKGATVLTENRYAADFSGSEYGSDILRSNFIHNQLLFQTVSKGSTINFKKATNYKLDQGHPVVGFIQNAPTGKDLETRVVFDRYDNYGNVMELFKSTDVHAIYLWGYNNTNPVAEIKNATYQEVLNVLGQSTIDGLNTSPGTDEQVRQTLNVLRSAPSLKKALITTFTYDPLAGITSQTDPNGVTIYYERDEMNRLKVIRDKDRNILKEYDYHYKTR